MGTQSLQCGTALDPPAAAIGAAAERSSANREHQGNEARAEGRVQVAGAAGSETTVGANPARAGGALAILAPALDWRR